GVYSHPGRSFGKLDGGTAQHQTPSGLRLRHTQAKKRQRSFQEDRLTEKSCEHNQVGRQDVGHHVADNDMQGTETESARGFDKRHLTQGEGATADYQSAPRYHGYRDGEDDIRHSGTQQRNHHQGQNDQWKRQKQIHKTLEQEIDFAAEIGARHADERSQGRPKKRRREPDP